MIFADRRLGCIASLPHPAVSLAYEGTLFVVESRQRFQEGIG